MVNYANIKLWGLHVGSVAMDDNTGVANFEYSPEFIHSGYELSPIFMPLQAGKVYSFPALNHETYKGLPGFLADSLPDKFGNDLINQWLVRNGRPKDSYNSVERLLYQGRRAMGALEFEPQTRPDLSASVAIELTDLVNTAIAILDERSSLNTNLNESSEAIKSILRVGASAGGSRAKAVVAYNKATGEIRSGQTAAPDGFEHYLLKLDGVTNGILGDPAHFGSIEYSFYKMAIDCGIIMNECNLYNEGARRHFMTKRFDRKGGDGKIHMTSLCGIAHMDFNAPGSYSYEQMFDIMRRLHLPYYDAEQAYRRMVFNVAGRNQDDHTKNVSFLMDTDGVWKLAPAYDMVYAYNPAGGYTAHHQMTINGKRDNITRDDLLTVARNANIKKAENIINETIAVMSNIDNYMESDIPEEMVDEIKNNLCLSI